MEPKKLDAPQESSVKDLIPVTPQPPLATMIQALQYQALPQLYASKECLNLRGLPNDVQPEIIIEFLAQHAESVIKDGLHIIYTSEGRPSCEAFIQMDSEEATLWAALHSNNRFMVVGHKPSRIEAFVCSVLEMKIMLARSLPGPPPSPPSAEELLPEPGDAQNPDQPPVSTSEPAEEAASPEEMSSTLAPSDMLTSEPAVAATSPLGVSSPTLDPYGMQALEPAEEAASLEGVSSTLHTSDMPTSEPAVAATSPPGVSSTLAVSHMPTSGSAAAATSPPWVLSTLVPYDMPMLVPSAAATPPPGLPSTFVPSAMPWSPPSMMVPPGGGKAEQASLTMLAVHNLPDFATKRDIMASFNCYPDLKPRSVYMMGDADRNLKGSAFVAVSSPANSVRAVLGKKCLYMCNRKVDLCIVDTDCALRWLRAPSRAHLYNVPPPTSPPGKWL